MLSSCGVNTDRWNWVKDLEKIFKCGLPCGTERQIETAVDILQRVLKSLKPLKESA